MKKLNSNELKQLALFKALTLDMYKTYKDKNFLYGDSFNNLVNKYGLVAAMVPLTNKLNRLESLLNVSPKDVKFESLEDTLLDLANYAAMTLVNVQMSKLAQAVDPNDTEEAFYNDMLNAVKPKEEEDGFHHVYKGSELTLPQRSTVSSAGYDFFSPMKYTLEPGAEVTIPTGIRCKLPKNQVLMLYPRSSLGCFGIALRNSVGVIDADYTGEIVVNLINNGSRTIEIFENEKVVQGVITEYKTFDNEVVPTKERGDGGFGSTGK